MPPGRPNSTFLEIIEETDRPRGILSKKDRQFLLNPSYREDLNPQSQRNVRSRLRNRLRNAILDFYILDDHLDDRDRDRVFSEIDEELVEGLHATLALLYRASDKNKETFESWFEGGLTHIEIEHRSRLLVDPPTVEIEITPGKSVDPGLVDEKIEAGDLEELTSAELRFLLWRVGRMFDDNFDEHPIFGVLTQFAERFENETQIAEARELLAEDAADG